MPALQQVAPSRKKYLTRREVMQRITGANTKPELTLRKALWGKGFRYRVRAKAQGCRPDLVFPSPRLVVFVDGCFWHGCPEHYTMPRTRSDFWMAKLRTNVERDRRQTIKLEEAGWRVLRVWEHELANPVAVVIVAERVAEFVVGREPKRSEVEWRVLSVVPLRDDWSREQWRLEALRDPSRRQSVTRQRAPKVVRHD